MRLQNMVQHKVSSCLISLSMICAAFAVATIASHASAAGKFDRSATPAPAADASATDAKKSAGDKKTDTKAAAPAGSAEKLDLSGLENRYWTAKDTEFTVVQNRLYTKAKKFSVTPFFGPLLSDTYTSSYNLGVSIDYYFSEREGVELQLWKTIGSPSDYVTALSSSQGAAPDFNTHQAYVGMSYVWVPIYAKMSVLEKKILYFDMSFSPGIGVTFLQAYTFASPPSFIQPTATNQAAITVAADIAQQVFLTEHFALRVDLRNHFYPETVYKANTGATVRSKITFDSSIVFGLSIFQ